METTTENRKRRGYVKKRVKTGRRTTEAPEVTTGLDEQERNSLEDILSMRWKVWRRTSSW